MPPLATADYVISAVVLVAAILGVFGGFSGALGFLSGLVAAGGAVRFGYGFFIGYFTSAWAAYLALLAAALLAFGIVRLIVRKIVHGLLAQPADAVFGALTAAVAGGAVALASAYFIRHLGLVEIESALLDLTAVFGIS